MYLGRAESGQNCIRENWTHHKGAILAGLAATTLGTAMTMTCYSRLDAEGLVPTLTLLAASALISGQGAVYAVQRLCFSRPREWLPLIGPAMTGAGAFLILASGRASILDLPNALVSALGGAALSCYGIWWTATANCSQPKPQAVDYLPF